MTATELKLVPCEKCEGPPNVYGGFRHPKTVFYHGDRIVIKCNNSTCGDEQVFTKVKK